MKFQVLILSLQYIFVKMKSEQGPVSVEKPVVKYELQIANFHMHTFFDEISKVRQQKDLIQNQAHTMIEQDATILKNSKRNLKNSKYSKNDYKTNYPKSSKSVVYRGSRIFFYEASSSSEDDDQVVRENQQNCFPFAHPESSQLDFYIGDFREKKLEDREEQQLDQVCKQIVGKNKNKFQKYDSKGEQEDSIEQLMRTKQQMSKFQKQKQKYQFMKRSQKFAKLTKKIDFSILKQKCQGENIILIHSDGQDYEKPKCEADQMKLRPQRNRRIANYIKRVLRAGKQYGGLSIRELIISVLKNYEEELELIRDVLKRNKRFECLRRRIYQCVSVLQALGLIRKKKLKNGGERVTLCNDKQMQSQSHEDKKRKLKKQLEDNETIMIKRKQQYFNLVSIQSVFRGIVARNKSSKIPEHQKLKLPIAILSGSKSSVKLKMGKSDPSLKKCDDLKLVGKNLKYSIAENMFIPLRQIFNPKKQIPKHAKNSPSQYLELLQNEDIFIEQTKRKLNIILEQTQEKQKQFFKESPDQKENPKK